MDPNLKKIKQYEDFPDLEGKRINAVIEFGASLKTPNLLSDGYTSAKTFMIENIVEIDDDIELTLINDTKPLYYSNNIHLKCINEKDIEITIPEYHEFDASYITGTTITLEQTTDFTIKIEKGSANVILNGPTQTDDGDNKILMIFNVAENIWEITQIPIGNIIRSVINEFGVITDDFVHGEKGRVLYENPDRPLHKLVTHTQPGFMDPGDKIKLDAVDLCPLIMHVETPEIHRPMEYSETFEAILYSEELITPTGPFKSFETWDDYRDFWCGTGDTGEE